MKKALWTQLPNASNELREAIAQGERGYGKTMHMLKKIKNLARRTPKRAAEERRYIALVAKWILLPENRLCRGCRAIWNREPWTASECHHFQGRRGKLLLYIPWWIPLCEKCHVWVTANARAASWLNLTCHPGFYNDPPPAEALAAFERNQLRKTNQ